MHYLPRSSWYFYVSKVRVKPKSYLSRQRRKTTHFSLQMLTAAPNPSVRTYSAQCAQDTWSINYVCGDLFSCPKDESLAHCISEDCRMGAGIAVMFKNKFGGVDDLKGQRKQVGECAVLQRDERFVYYLITKKSYNDKPTYHSLKQSLEDMKIHCRAKAVSKVTMPRIGCGLDRLEWRQVSEILKEVFEHSDISITVYSLPEKTQTTVRKENFRQKRKR